MHPAYTVTSFRIALRSTRFDHAYSLGSWDGGMHTPVPNRGGSIVGPEGVYLPPTRAGKFKPPSIPQRPKFLFPNGLEVLPCCSHLLPFGFPVGGNRGISPPAALTIGA